MSRFLIGFLPGIVTLFGCLYLYRVEDTETRTRSSALVNVLDLTSGNGAVTATATDTDTDTLVKITRYAYGRNRADALKRLQEVTLADTLDGGVWSLKVKTPDITKPLGALFDAKAPSNTRLNIQSSNGKVKVSGFSAGVTISTSNGQVVLTGTSGDASVNTSNASVLVQVHNGGITIQTSNGEIECDLASLPATRSAYLTTSNGRVTLRLPPDVSATIEATTSAGTVVVTGYQLEYQEQTRNRIRARIGSGASPIKVVTSNGDIVISARYL